MSHESSIGSVKSAIIDLVAGSIGGTALVYVGQPFDTVKVKMQSFPKLYSGMIDCFTKTFRNDGIVRGLYAGTVPSVVANVAENSILFMGYGFCQKLIMQLTNTNKPEDLSILQNASAGCLAAFGSSLTLCPTELIKCKLQAMREIKLLNPNVKQDRVGPVTLTRQIIQTQGIRGLFNGLTATIVREMPGYFFFFGGYEGTRELLRKPNQSKDDIGLLKTMISGSVGGMVFWIVIFPVDVVKTRMQITNVKASVTNVVLNIFREEGIFALYTGLLPTIVRTIPATATLFVVFEYSKKYMLKIFSNSLNNS